MTEAIATLRDDLRAAFRSLAHRPAFTLAVVLTLAVALGANTAVFSVLEQTLLRPLDIPHADRAVFLYRQDPTHSFQVTPTLGQVRSWREEARSFEAIEVVQATRETLLGHGEPRKLPAARVSPGLFRLLGVAPRIGPGFTAAGTAGGGEVLLGDRLWREAFGADPAAVGKAIRLGDKLFTVVGVLPPGVHSVPGMGRADLWVRLRTAPGERLAPRVLALLRPGVSPRAAEKELVAIETRRNGAKATAAWRPEVIRPRDFFGQFLGRAVILLQVAVGVILLIGCANVGNLYLLRAAGRGREIAVRSALGASRGRLVRSLLVESTVVAGIAGLLGLALAIWGGGLLASLYPGGSLHLSHIRLDAGLLGFALAATFVAVLAFGLTPALVASRAGLGEALKTGLRGAATGAAGGRARSALVLVEIALSLVLLVGAGLLAKSFIGLVRADPGFDSKGLLTVSIDLPKARYPSSASQAAFVASLRDAFASAPDGALAMASSVPTESSLFFGHLETEAGKVGRDDSPQTVVWVAVGPSYFRTLGIPILEGRPLAAGDEPAASEDSPVVVNRALASLLWPGQSALGRRFRLGSSPKEGWSRVVGVVGNVAQEGVPSQVTTLQAYGVLHAAPHVALLARISGPARGGGAWSSRTAFLQRLTSRLHALDPALALDRVRTADELLGADLARPRFDTTLMLSFAALALALAVVGLYAVLAYAVRLRAFEIGVRSALGARPAQVLGLVARQGGRLVGAGLALGIAAALGLTRLLGHLLYGVAPTDPAVFAAAAALLALTTAAATLVPALRAARLDPADVLREE